MANPIDSLPPLREGGRKALRKQKGMVIIMKKIIVIPDSFKGTLSSADICLISKEEILSVFPGCDVVSVPVADGGEGSVDCFLSALGGEKISIPVKGPYFEDVSGFYGVLPDGVTAVIEMAATSGLPLVASNKNPMLTTTYGTGQLILDAARRGCRKIIVGLGGSATNDAGCGMAAALGVQFIGEDGLFIPTGGTLGNVLKIKKNLSWELDGIEFITMCDIDNPMYGENGAAYVFAPQKGASPEQVLLLDDGLIHISKIIYRDLGIDVGYIKGAGAAGGMGAGMVAFLNSKLQMGIQTVLDIIKFNDMLEDTALVLTGEGKLDSQSLRGKAVVGIARRARAKNVPVIAIVGGYDTDLSQAYGEGVSAVFSINRLPEPLEISGPQAKENFRLTMRNVLRLLDISQS